MRYDEVDGKLGEGGERGDGLIEQKQQHQQHYRSVTEH